MHISYQFCHTFRKSTIQIIPSHPRQRTDHTSNDSPEAIFHANLFAYRNVFLNFGQGNATRCPTQRETLTVKQSKIPHKTAPADTCSAGHGGVATVGATNLPPSGVQYPVCGRLRFGRQQNCDRSKCIAAPEKNTHP